MTKTHYMLVYLPLKHESYKMYIYKSNIIDAY